MDRPIVHVLGWFAGSGGYNVHARKLAEALERRVPVLRTELPRRAGQVTSMAAGLEDAAAAGRLVNLMIAFGEHAGWMAELPGPKIAFVVWETSRLPDSWREPLKLADRWWVPCRWGRDVLVAHGFDPTRIDVVPEGVDPDAFRPDAPPAPAVAALDGFRFIHVGKFEPRKATAELIRAFDAEFADEAVRLVLAVDNPFVDGFDLKAELATLRLRRPERLFLLKGPIRHEAMAGLYTACEAAVFASRSEPWGLPILEAMACGLPTIAPRFAGPADYMTDETGIALPWTPARCPHFPVRMADGDYGDWSEPDIPSLRRLMRRLVEAPEEGRAIGRRAAAAARRDWSWDRAAGTALAAIAEAFRREPWSSASA